MTLQYTSDLEVCDAIPYYKSQLKNVVTLSLKCVTHTPMIDQVWKI